MLLRLLILAIAAAAASAQCGCKPGDEVEARGSQLPQPDPETGLVEGDMRLTTNNYLELLGLRNTDSKLWPDGILHYAVSVEDRRLTEALHKLQVATGNCVRFVRSSGQAAYVDVVDKGQCWSFVGRTGRRQELSLGVNCYSEGTIQHEFLHALGFYHEHSRTDRDRFVTVHWGNIRSTACPAFYKLGTIPNGFPTYDTQSVMHYQTRAFSCGVFQKSITTKSGGNVGGKKLSSLDVAKIKALYRCR